MKTKTLSITTVLLCLAAITLAPVHADLSGMKVIKLFSKGQTNYGNRQFGAAVAINETYAVVGEPAYNAVTPSGGAVHVFNVATGAFIRTIKPTTSVANDGFGSSLALNAKLLLVGADGHNAVVGSCYLFDLSTGKQLKQLSNQTFGEGFGSVVAMTDTLLLMGSPEFNGARGKVRMEGITSNFSATITDGGVNAGDRFGSAIHAYGERIAIGAPGSRKVHYYNRIVAGGVSTSTGVGFGSTLAGSGYDLYTSAPYDSFYAANSGSVNSLFFTGTIAIRGQFGPDANDNRVLGKLLTVDGNLLVCSFETGMGGQGLSVNDVTTNRQFLEIPLYDIGSTTPATAIALSAGRLLVGSATDATQGMAAGAAYLIQSLPQPQPFETVATKGAPAPGFVGITFNALGDTVFNSSGHCVMQTTLSGVGSNGNRDSGIYAQASSGGFFESVVKSRESWFGSVLFGSLGSPMANDSTFSIFPATLTGPGITSANNRVLLGDSGSTITTILRTGITLGNAVGTSISVLRQSAQSYSANRVAVRVDAKVGLGGTTALNDSAIMLQTHFGVNSDLVREDDAIAGGTRRGQIAPRMAFHSDVCWFSGAIRGTGITSANDTGLFRRTPGGGTLTFKVKGSSIPTAADIKYSAFLGEGGSMANPCIRATVSGAGLTAASNEMIFFDRGTGLTAVAQKGTMDTVRIIRVWPMGTRLLIHSVIRGNGITTANNEALDLYQEDGSYSRLVQKGEVLPQTGGLRIGAIQRVEVGEGTKYALLVSLTGAASTSNQMLLRGDVNQAPITDLNESSLRRPTPLLRKGQTFTNGYAGSARLTSMAFANVSTQDASGVGGKGLGSVIGFGGSVLVRATFSDGSTRLIRLD